MVHTKKETATEFRKAGKSFKEIMKTLNIPKSTLSYWFKNTPWSRTVTVQNTQEAILKSTAHIKKMNSARSAKLKKAYEETENEAIAAFKKYKHESLFVAGLMLYLGEGDKNIQTNLVRISNIDFSVLQITQLFLKRYCGVEKEKIRFWVLLYPDLDQELCEKKWLHELDLTTKNLYKKQVIQGRHKAKRLRYGVGNIILGNKHLKVKILKWIELLSQDLAEEKYTAGMV